MTGQIAPNLYAYAGDPTNVSTNIINPPVNALVFDSTNSVIYRKTSAKGDNSGYVLQADAATLQTILSATKTQTKLIATPVAAAGSAIGSAALLGSANLLYISSDSAAKGVKLVAGVAGDVVDIINTSGTAAIVYPATGGTINGLAANAGVLIPASKGLRLFCSVSNTWLANDMPARATAA